MKILIVLIFAFSTISFAAEKTKPRTPNSTRGKSSKARLQTGTPDVFIGSLKNGGDEDCPVLIVENSSETCSKFGFVDLSLQTSVMNAIKSDSEFVKLSGKWGTRETGQGKKAPLFIIDFVTTE